MTEIMLEATDIRKVLGDDAGASKSSKVSICHGGGELTLLHGSSGSGKTSCFRYLDACPRQPAARSNSWLLDDGQGSEESAKLCRENVGSF